MLEKQMRKTRPEYEAYCLRTSAFVPMPRRRARTRAALDA
jgi:steroid 5-alpha reductase family enzyme